MRDKLLHGSITEAEFQLVCFGQISICEMRLESISIKPGQLPGTAGDGKDVSRGSSQEEIKATGNVSAIAVP